MIYPGSQIQLTGVFKSDAALTAPEGASYLHTEDPIEKVEESYYKVFMYNGWNIIQSHKKPGEALIMAESPFGKLLTVILRGNKGTDIKIYVKRLGAE